MIVIPECGCMKGLVLEKVDSRANPAEILPFISGRGRSRGRKRISAPPKSAIRVQVISEEIWVIDRTDSVQSQCWSYENALMCNCGPGILEVVLIKLPLRITANTDVCDAKPRPFRLFITLQI